MEPCATYQNTHHQLTVVIGSQWGNTCWPFRFKLMSNINAHISKNTMVTVSILHVTTRPDFVPTKTSRMAMIFIS